MFDIAVVVMLLMSILFQTARKILSKGLINSVALPIDVVGSIIEVPVDEEAVRHSNSCHGLLNLGDIGVTVSVDCP